MRYNRMSWIISDFSNLIKIKMTAVVTIEFLNDKLKAISSSATNFSWISSESKNIKIAKNITEMYKNATDMSENAGLFCNKIW